MGKAMAMTQIGCLILVAVLVTASCSVISREVRDEAVPPVPFRTLAQAADQYEGKTMILGGYIIGTRNLDDETIIEVLQTPLGSQDKPKSRDLSEGRLIVSYEGFLDPEVYRTNRKITVAGTLTGCTIEKVQVCRIKSHEVYLWPDYQYRYPYGYYPGQSVLLPYHRDPYRYHRYDRYW
jgi:outer membrane lipoprotein